MLFIILRYYFCSFVINTGFHGDVSKIILLLPEITLSGVPVEIFLATLAEQNYFLPLLQNKIKRHDALSLIGRNPNDLNMQIKFNNFLQQQLRFKVLRVQLF